MSDKNKWITGGVILLICIIINFYSHNNYRVENGYSINFYPVFSNFLRFLFGWISFSIGDFIYGGIVIYLLWKIYKLLKQVFIVKINKKTLLKKMLFSIFIKCGMLYIIFNIFWGINYNRIGIANQLNITVDTFSIESLKGINAILVEKINSSKQVLLKTKIAPPSDKELFAQTEKAFSILTKKYSFLSYNNASIKSSMWGWLGNYTGFLGYYNPFTGEAQMNTTVPKFTQPFTACHEVAHQIGYAKEMEANFVGYLAASSSTDTFFRYSVYTDLFTYANRTLYMADGKSALEYRKKLMPEVIFDFKERKKFNDSHRSFTEPIVSYLYGKFLEQNQQPNGILSYDEVTAFIIAYYKKFGTI